MIRRIGKQGAITLPKILRVEAGLHPGMAVNITVESGAVSITAAHKCCALCGSPEDVRSAAGINVCMSCAREITEVIK